MSGLRFLLPAALTLTAASAPGAEKFTLRYLFKPGQTLRWEVTHRAKIDTTISGASQTAETQSRSVKVWRVTAVQPDGSATFQHLVESVDMRHKFAGRPEVRYNSLTDKQAPAGFEQVAQSLGVPLTSITLDARGKVLKRQQHSATAVAAPPQSQITLPLPESPVAVGETWSLPNEVAVNLPQGGSRRIKTVQRFSLESVKNGVAAISVSTQVLTPIHDPALESQLMECAAAGTVRFDLDAGRILSQQLDVDKGVVGFRGETSSVHYLTRFTESLLPDAPKTASQSGEKRG